MLKNKLIDNGNVHLLTLKKYLTHTCNSPRSLDVVLNVTLSWYFLRTLALGVRVKFFFFRVFVCFSFYNH